VNWCITFWERILREEKGA